MCSVIEAQIEYEEFRSKKSVPTYIKHHDNVWDLKLHWEQINLAEHDVWLMRRKLKQMFADLKRGTRVKKKGPEDPSWFLRKIGSVSQLDHK